MREKYLKLYLTILFSSLILTSCSLTPEGFSKGVERNKDAGERYSKAFEQRDLVELPDSPSWKDVLQRGLLVNGDLEAAYFDWQASLERVRSESSYPNTNTMLGYNYLFSKEKMKSFDRSSFSLGIDQMLNLSFPGKVIRAGKQAFEEALSKEEEFHAYKFKVQGELLSTWAQYEAVLIKVQLENERLKLYQILEQSSIAQQLTGGTQRDALLQNIKTGEIQNGLLSLMAKERALRAKLNGLIARDANAPIKTQSDVEIRPLTISDEKLIEVSTSKNPELLALAHEVKGKEDALEQARLAWIPDLNPSFMFTGTIDRTLGATLVLPTAISKIQAQVDAAKASLESNKAKLRQAKFSNASMFIGTLVLVRDMERQIQFYNTNLAPFATMLSKNAEISYQTGFTKLNESIDDRVMLLSIKTELLDMKVEYTKMLSELESLMGIDIEAIKSVEVSSGKEA